MSSVRVVTTLHEDGYNLYGKDFIKTWAIYFPEKWRISYYAEKHNPDLDPRIDILDFNKECPEWSDYYKHIQNLVKDISNKKELNRYRKALRWSFKMFTLLNALNKSKERYVIWLDSDVYARNFPDKGWIEQTLDGNCIAGQMERVKGFPHVETGLLIIDTEHPDIDKVKKWIHRGYIGKEILKESKPWDGIWIAKLFVSNTVEARHISITTRNSVAVPFSDLSMKWLTHKVGDSKFNDTYSGRSGRTLESELI
jgi:hypothetical protein